MERRIEISLLLPRPPSEQTRPAASFESGSAVTGSPHSKGDAHAFDLCSPRRSLAHRREAARNSALVTRLVPDILRPTTVAPSTRRRVCVSDLRPYIRWSGGFQSAVPKPADWKSPLFENNFANFARIFPEYHVIAIFALRNHESTRLRAATAWQADHTNERWNAGPECRSRVNMEAT